MIKKYSQGGEDGQDGAAMGRQSTPFLGVMSKTHPEHLQNIGEDIPHPFSKSVPSIKRPRSDEDHLPNQSKPPQSRGGMLFEPLPGQSGVEDRSPTRDQGPGAVQRLRKNNSEYRGEARI